MLSHARAFWRCQAAIALLLLASCTTLHNPDDPLRMPVELYAFPEPGACMPKASRGYVLVVHRGGDFCGVLVSYHGIVYDIDSACEAGIVLFVSTRDRNFRTADNLTMRSTLKDAYRAGGVASESGDRCEVALPSGWTAIFNSCDEEESDNIVSTFENNLTDDEIKAVLSPPQGDR